MSAISSSLSWTFLGEFFQSLYTVLDSQRVEFRIRSVYQKRSYCCLHFTRGNLSSNWWANNSIYDEFGDGDWLMMTVHQLFSHNVYNSLFSFRAYLFLGVRVTNCGNWFPKRGIFHGLEKCRGWNQSTVRDYLDFQRFQGLLENLLGVFSWGLASH